MDQRENRRRLTRRSMLYCLAALGAVLCIGCMPAYVARHDTGVIKKQFDRQPRPAWGYPPSSMVREAKPFVGLSGLVKPEPVPDMMKEVEPPLIASMTVLSDGSLVCVSPLALQYDSVKFVFATFWRELMTQVKVTLFKGENGSVQWSQVISAAGIYEIKEFNNSTLLFQSRKFNSESRFVEATLAGLDRKNGAILWQRSFTQPFRSFLLSARHNLIIFSLNTGDAKGGWQKMEAIDAVTGKACWSVTMHGPVGKNSEGIIWPIIADQDIVLFDGDVVSRKLQSGQVVWERKDLVIEGTAQPEIRDGILYVQTTNGLMAIKADSGKSIWTCADIKKDITKLNLTENYLFAIQSEKGWFSKTNRLFLVDRGAGRVLWQHENDPLLGNIVTSQGAVFFSTKDRLIALDLTKGSVLYKAKVPWDDDFSPHGVTLRDSSVAIENEWNVALWNQEDGKLVYHHRFEPLCPIISTKERMLEQKALGVKVTSMNTGALTYSSYMPTASYEAKYQDSLSRYRSTGNSSDLSDARFYGQMARSSARMDMAISQSIALSQSVLTASVAISRAKIQLSHAMVYPAIDATMQNHRASDTHEYAVRLVGVEIAGQRFSALEFLQVSTGKQQRMLLSPYQMPDDLKTIGSNSFSAHELSGYLLAAPYMPHNYLYAVDFARNRIYHYGAGLNTDEYVRYGQGGFIRGRLWMIPLELPALQR